MSHPQLQFILTTGGAWSGDDGRGTVRAFFDDILAFVRMEEEALEDGMPDIECEDDLDVNLLEWWNK